MQYFIGYSGFSDEPIFDSSLFVDLRKRFGVDQINEINETIMGLGAEVSKSKKEEVRQSNSSDSEALNDTNNLKSQPGHSRNSSLPPQLSRHPIKEN